MIDLDLDAVSAPLVWREIFGRDAPTDLEMGAGKGRFLLELAASRPDRNFLAVERAAKYHALCCTRAAKRGIGNIRLLRTTAEDVVYRLLQPDSVATVFVLFPDPWPKKRHHKRRFFTSDAVAAVARALVPGGRLLVKTDHAGYAEVIGSLMDAEPLLESIDPLAAFEGLPTTGFEHKYVDQGREIFGFAARRV